jgi:hypothetical protein
MAKNQHVKCAQMKRYPATGDASCRNLHMLIVHHRGHQMVLLFCDFGLVPKILDVLTERASAGVYCRPTAAARTHFRHDPTTTDVSMMLHVPAGQIRPGVSVVSGAMSKQCQGHMCQRRPLADRIHGS